MIESARTKVLWTMIVLAVLLLGLGLLHPVFWVLAVAPVLLVAVGVFVAVAVAVAVGATNVNEPSLVVNEIGKLLVSFSETLESVKAVVPSATVANSIVVRRPLPVAPVNPPVVEQAKLTVPGPSMGGKHETLRPVEPRNGPFVALMNDNTEESHVSVKA